MTFDHIGLFVRDIESGRDLLSILLPIASWGEVFDDADMHVRVCFGTDESGIRYELVAPFGEPNPVARALATGQNLLNHVAYRVPDILIGDSRLRAAGAIPIGEPTPAVAFGGALVAFFLSPLGFVVELVEEPRK